MKVNVYVKKDLYLKLELIAEWLNIPVANLIRQCVEEEIDTWEDLFNMVANNVKK